MAVGGVGGAHRGAGQLVQPGGTGGVVRMAVGDEDELHGAGRGEGLEVGLVQRAGIDHHGARAARSPAGRRSWCRPGSWARDWGPG